MRRSSSLSRIPLMDRRSTLHRTSSSKDLLHPSSAGSNRRTTKLRRSNSSTNLRGRRSPSRSPVRDARPVYDKKWQHEQLTKVRLYLGERPDLAANLKPMSIAVYVEAMEILLKKIDPRIVVKKEDYKETVPYYMKLLGYPTTISPSLMKSVNLAHSWPQIIAMMSWIVDIIEESEDASLKRPKSGGEILAIIDKYIAQSDQIDGDDLLEGFKQALLKEHDFNFKELETLETEAEHITVVLTQAQAQEEAINAAIMSEKKLISDYEFKKQQNLELQKKIELGEIKMENLKSQKKHLDEAIALKTDRIANLKAIVKGQEGQRQIIAQLKNFKQQLIDEINSAKQQNSEMLKVYENFDIELEQKISKVKAMVMAKNAELTNLMHLDPTLYDLQFRTYGFTSDDYLDLVTAISRKASSTAAKYRELGASQDAQLVEAKEERKKLEEKLAEETTHLARLEAERSERMRTKDRLIEEMLEKKERALLEKSKCMVELEGIEEEVRLLERRREELEEEGAEKEQRNMAMVEMNRKEVLEGIVLVEDLRSQALKKFEETTKSSNDKLYLMEKRYEEILQKIKKLMGEYKNCVEKFH